MSRAVPCVELLTSLSNMMVPAVPYLTRPPSTLQPPPPGFPVDLYGFCLPRAQIIMEECLAAALYICNNELAEFGISEIFEIVSQIIPTAFALNTGLWVFYRRLDDVSLCVCGRFALPCKHNFKASGAHCVDLTSFPISPPGARFQAKKFGEICPKDYRFQIVSAAGDYSPFEMRVDLLLEHTQSADETSSLPPPMACTLHLKFSFVTQFYPHLLSLVMEPNPVLLDCYSKYFTKLSSRYRARNCRSPSYAISFTQVPDFTVTMLVINLPPPMPQPVMCARLCRDPIYGGRKSTTAEKASQTDPVEIVTPGSCPHYLRRRGPWKITAPELRELLDGDPSRTVMAATTLSLQNAAMASIAATAASKLLTENRITQSLRTFGATNSLAEGEAQRMRKNAKKNISSELLAPLESLNVSGHSCRKRPSEDSVTFADIVKQSQEKATESAGKSGAPSFLQKNSGGTMVMRNSNAQKNPLSAQPSTSATQIWSGRPSAKRPEKFVGYSQQFPALRRSTSEKATKPSSPSVQSADRSTLSASTTEPLEENTEKGSDYYSEKFSELIAAIRHQIDLEHSDEQSPNDEMATPEKPSSNISVEVPNKQRYTDLTQTFMKQLQEQERDTLPAAPPSDIWEESHQQVGDDDQAAIRKSTASSSADIPRPLQLQEADSMMLTRVSSEECMEVQEVPHSLDNSINNIMFTKPSSNASMEVLRASQTQVHNVSTNVLSPYSFVTCTTELQSSQSQAQKVDGMMLDGYSRERFTEIEEAYATHVQSDGQPINNRSFYDSWASPQQISKPDVLFPTLEQTAQQQSPPTNFPVASCDVSTSLPLRQEVKNVNSTMLPRVSSHVYPEISHTSQSEAQGGNESIASRHFYNSSRVRQLLQSTAQNADDTTSGKPSSRGHWKLPAAPLKAQGSIDATPRRRSSSTNTWAEVGPLSAPTHDSPMTQFPFLHKSLRPQGPNYDIGKATTPSYVRAPPRSAENANGSNSTMPRSVSYADVSQLTKLDAPPGYHKQFSDANQPVSDGVSSLYRLDANVPTKLPSYSEAFHSSVFSARAANQQLTPAHLRPNFEGHPMHHRDGRREAGSPDAYIGNLQHPQGTYLPMNADPRISSSSHYPTQCNLGSMQEPMSEFGYAASTSTSTEVAQTRKNPRSTRGGRGAKCYGGRRGRKVQHSKRKSCDRLVKLGSRKKGRKQPARQELPLDENTQFPNVADRVSSPTASSDLSFRSYFQENDQLQRSGLSLDDEFDIVEGVIQDNIRRDLIRRGVTVPENFDWRKCLKQSRVDHVDRDI